MERGGEEGAEDAKKAGTNPGAEKAAPTYTSAPKMDATRKRGVATTLAQAKKKKKKK